MSQLALQVHRSVPRYLASRAVAGRFPGTVTGGLAPLRLVARSTPRPPASGWARVRPRLAGICGSDLGLLSGTSSPYFSGLVTFPLTPGHEIVAELRDDLDDLPRGTRVVVDPVLSCVPRGVPPCRECAAGNTGRCEHVTVGHLAPGLQTGYCADVGGGWSHELVAHRAQLHPIPDALPDDRAVLIEPLACAVHAALRAQPSAGEHLLVIGSGTIGLLTLLALRAVTDAEQVTTTAKHPRQADLARAFGASTVVRPDLALGSVRRDTRAFRVQPELGGDFLLGGVDVAIDCVGSTGSLELALRATRAGGRVVLAAMPPPKVDLSPAWFRELEVLGAYATGAEPTAEGRSSFDLAIEFAQTAPLDDLTLVTYPLQHWRQAIDHAIDAGRLGTAKVAFDLTA